MIDVNSLTAASLAGLIDHTQLKAFAGRADIEKLCREAAEYGFGAVCVNSCNTALARELLKGAFVHVGATVSFPLGQTSIETKVFETKEAVENGAGEIDYVINIAKLKDGDYGYIEREMSMIVEACHEGGALCKVIFENCYLEKAEIEKCAAIALKVKPDFIKTSTGFGTGGATVEDVERMKQAVGGDVKVKAAGGIRSWETCRAMILAGAERIGTSSGIKIIEEFLK